MALNATCRQLGALLALWLSLGLSPAATANEIRVLQPGQWPALLAEHPGQPKLIAFWSATCAHCPGELKALGQLKRQYPALHIVLIAADSPRDIPLLAELAQQYGLAQTPQWVFAEVPPEQLRFEIDRHWYGELPRTLFIDRQGRSTGRSGVQSKRTLAHWARHGRLPGETAEQPAHRH